MAFSRLANRISLAKASSLPTPVARPRIEAMDTTGTRLRRTSISGNACKPVGPGGIFAELFQRRQEVVVGEKEAVDGTVEYHDLDLLIPLDRRDDLAQLQRLLRAKDVHRRKVESDSPI